MSEKPDFQQIKTLINHAYDIDSKLKTETDSQKSEITAVRQVASVIVFCEPQLTPAIENQAVSRAYRMGQTRDVLVHRLLADDTIDERMLEILSKSRQNSITLLMNLLSVIHSLRHKIHRKIHG